MTDNATPEVDPALIDRLNQVTLTVTLDGEVNPPYIPGEKSTALSAALRTQSHGIWRVANLNRSIFDFHIGPDGEPAIELDDDQIAAVIFMGRRQAGAVNKGGVPFSYDAVCAEVDAATEAHVAFGSPDDDEDEGEPDSPLG